MTTEADRLTTMEVKLDGFIEETRNRFNDMNTNMNSRFNDIENRFSRIENRLNAQLAISFVNLIGAGALVILIIKS